MCSHQGYTGKKQPKVDCLDCWKLWALKHSDATVTGTELVSIMKAVSVEINESARNSLPAPY